MAIFTSAISGPLIRWSMRWRPRLRLAVGPVAEKLSAQPDRATRFDAIRELVALAARHTDLNQRACRSPGVGTRTARRHRHRQRRRPAACPRAGSRPADGRGRRVGGRARFRRPRRPLAHVIFLLLTPVENPTAQLDLSANIAEIFRDPRSLEHVLRAQTYTEFLAALKTLAPKAT